ncbi:hypothetical protein L1785_16780 [Antribacter sp. KLBMP9083]|uniref:Uncharacterized protein n=1 Tax=Antribacter soli TaxID=2910976 RepID=A0AA41QFR1_9MICO|nr:hypothetical protein [Antribacter soli]MCF4122635.1 hypothetical protein [Antribacter soli]
MTTSTDRAPATGQTRWAWRVDPPDGWLVVPSAVTEDHEDVATWEREATAAVRASLEPQPGDDGEPAELDDAARSALDRAAAESVASLREFADGMAPAGHRVAAAVGVLGRGPVPVLVAVGVSDPAEPDDGLMAALGATGGYPAAPPDIEYLDLPDGDGVRVVRLDVGEVTGGAWMSVCLGRRTEHPDAVVDTVLVWRTQDLLLGAAMVELLDELLPAVRITRGGT